MALVSINKNIDYSTDQGKLMTIMLASFAEYFSNSLGASIKKGIGERALQGRYLGGIPFGYSPCWEGPKGDRRQSCDPEHPGGVHPVPKEADAGQVKHRDQLVPGSHQALVSEGLFQQMCYFPPLADSRQGQFGDFWGIPYTNA